MRLADRTSHQPTLDDSSHPTLPEKYCVLHTELVSASGCPPCHQRMVGHLAQIVLSFPEQLQLMYV